MASFDSLVNGTQTLAIDPLKAVGYIWATTPTTIVEFELPPAGSYAPPAQPPPGDYPSPGQSPAGSYAAPGQSPTAGYAPTADYLTQWQVAYDEMPDGSLAIPAKEANGTVLFLTET